MGVWAGEREGGGMGGWLVWVAERRGGGGGEGRRGGREKGRGKRHRVSQPEVLLHELPCPVWACSSSKAKFPSVDGRGGE